MNSEEQRHLTLGAAEWLIRNPVDIAPDAGETSSLWRGGGLTWGLAGWQGQKGRSGEAQQQAGPGIRGSREPSGLTDEKHGLVKPTVTVTRAPKGLSC